MSTAAFFLADGYSSDSFQSWFERSNHDLYAVQSLLNHRHISDMFLQGSDAKPSRIQLEYIGQLLVEMWSSKLHREFPNLQIHVELLNFDSDDWVSPAITFGVVNSY
ncbi:hypothetical protein [Celerinatantimonas sp. MCCC 1A17872]|uniref:hypothetical protein n=1 Tax=Celerinatantimonas sp. MCCC 1A17872 TaxID=3177514 RepID=UPI0038C2AE7D